MENTACGDQCAFVKSGLCKTDKECCNYAENWWKSTKDDKPILVQDCTPKRLLRMQHEQVNYTLNLQQSVNEMKNELNHLTTILMSLIGATKAQLEELKSEQKHLMHDKEV